jgi:mono/diheme cytochrome c family protein
MSQSARTCGTVAAVLTVMLTLPAAAAVGNKDRGEFYAREHCATCHAVGRLGGSPYPKSPPFRTLHEHYAVEGLAEALAEGIIVSNTGAREMPEFVLSPDEIDDFIAYLKSLEPGTPPARKTD